MFATGEQMGRRKGNENATQKFEKPWGEEIRKVDTTKETLRKLK